MSEREVDVETIPVSPRQVKIIELYRQGLSTGEVAKETGSSKRYCRHVKTSYPELLNKDSDLEVISALSKTMSSKQRLQDINRVERKARRTQDRYANAIEEYLAEIKTSLDSISLKNSKVVKKWRPGGKVSGLVQISDCHFNELIDLPFNAYDFTIAAKRLQKLAGEARRVFKAYGIVDVTVAMTGDLMNSDRRLDELLNKATNRSRATVLSALLLEQFILDLNHDFNVSVIGVVGNESRVQAETGFTDALATDNYDVMIFELLRLMFSRSKKDIRFHESRWLEATLEINGHNCLFLHGNQINNGGITTQVQKIKAKVQDQLGSKIDYVFFGHLHASQICDLYARSSSLCGGNSYSSDSLQLSSRAAQTVAIFTKDAINTMRIDLQETVGIDGYDIEKQLEAYNAVGVSRCRRLKSKAI
jgi:predicted phosphodiesterase